MNNQDQVPTIAELWKEAEFLIELTIPHYEGLANPNNRVNEERRPIYVEGLAKCKDKLESIRQQLLERLDLIKVNTPNNRHAYMLFGFTGANDEAISFIPRNDNDGEFMPTIEQCNELSAMFAFCAWELEQREKEASGD